MQIGRLYYLFKFYLFPLSDKLDPKIHVAAQKSLERIARLQAERAAIMWSS